MQQLKKNGTYKDEQVITAIQGNKMQTTQFGSTINFCSNNYLGLNSHKAVIEASKRGLSQYGFGLNSVRFICGTTIEHKKLEHEISAFYEQEDTLLFSSCFDANAAIFEALLDNNDSVHSHYLNHASIIHGIRLSKA